MYFIVDPDGLIGKEIAFVMANQFCTHLTFVTKDKGIFMVEQDGHETSVYNAFHAQRTLYNDTYVKNQLAEQGLITKEDWAEYDAQLKREAEERRKKHEKQKEEQERKQWEELNKKFGTPPIKTTE